MWTPLQATLAAGIMTVELMVGQTSFGTEVRFLCDRYSNDESQIEAICFAVLNMLPAPDGVEEYVALEPILKLEMFASNIAMYGGFLLTTCTAEST